MPTTLTCQNCGFQGNSATARFCGQCAARLPLVCPTCGTLNAPGFRFCGQCATSLATPAALRSGRRVVTVLFVDVCNSTALTAALGAERMYTMLDDLLRRLCDVVSRFEGTVDKITGDGLMAVFGMPTALENHAIQATLAALTMRDELARFNQESRGQTALRFQTRLGLASGEVVSGGLGTDRSSDVTVIGDVVNLAVRLQQNADPDTILLDSQCAARVEPLVELVPQLPVAAKGFAEPIAAWRLLGERAQPGLLRGVRGQRTPLVGRQAERAQLEAALERLARGENGVVCLFGEAGIGKSRLTNEVLAPLKARGARVLEGDCFSHMRTVPYSAFMGVIRDFVGILPTDSREVVQGKFAQATREALAARGGELVPYLEYLLSINLVDEALVERVRHLDPAQLKRQVFLALRDLLRAAAQRQPVVVVLDDLQWSDELSAELVAFLAEVLWDAPVLLYLIARGDYQPFQRAMFEQVLSAAGDKGLRLALAPLSDADLAQMARALLPDAAPDAVAWLVRHAEGVPFYLEELVRHALEGGLDMSAPGRVGLAVPASLEALIRARYDRLPEALQRLLAHAAVVGRRFALPLLHALQPDEAIEAPLQELRARGFVRPRRATVDEWSFVHILTQETILKSLLARQREALHGAVGTALETLASDRLDEQVEVLAYHFGRSVYTDKAIFYLLRAALRAAGRFANDEALRLYDEAQRLLDTIAGYPSERLLLESGRADVLALVGQYDGARAAFQRALALLPALPQPDATLHASLERRLAGAFEKQNRYDEAKAHLALARVALQGRDDGGERVRIDSDAGWVAFVEGRLDEAEQLLRAALEEAERRQDHSMQARIYNRLAGVHFQRGDQAGAQELLSSSLELSKKLDDFSAVALALGNLGIIAQSRNDWAAAETYYLESSLIHNRNGDIVGQLRTNSNAASMAYQRGHFDAAMETLENVYALAESVNISNYKGVARSNQGRIAFFRGETELSRRYFIEAWCSYHRVKGYQANSADVAEYLGRIAFQRGKTRTAFLMAQKALSMAERVQAKAEAYRARRLLAFVYSHAGFWDEASDLIANLRNEPVADGYDKTVLMVVEAAHLQNKGLLAEAAQLHQTAQSSFERQSTPAPLRRFVSATHG